jgi:hypothetical protein
MPHMVSAPPEMAGPHLDLHLSAAAIRKRLGDMTDAELAALKARITITVTHALELS